MDTFKYIHAPTYEHNPYEVMENKYKTIEQLQNKFIVGSYGSTNSGYRVYDTATQFISDLDAMDEPERTFHEVIFDQPQKLKFDIDAPIDKIRAWVQPTVSDDVDTPELSELDILACALDEFMQLGATNDDIYVATCGAEHAHDITPESKYAHIFETIIAAIVEAFFMRFGIDLETDNIIICQSRNEGAATHKYSNHIIINGYYVSGCMQAQEFTRDVIKFLPQVYHQFIDLSVNKSVQCFRIAGCHKVGDDRVKRIIGGVDGPLVTQTLITQINGCKRLDDIVSVKGRIESVYTTLHPDDIAAAEKIVFESISDPQAWEFRMARGCVLTFRRKQPSECSFCNEVHHHDSSMTANVHAHNGMCVVYKQCRQYILTHGKDGNHSVRLGEFVSALASSPVPVDIPSIVNNDVNLVWADRIIKKLIDDNIVATPSTLFDSLPNKYIFNEPVLEPFPLAHTLCVHAAMKMGKTKALKTYLQTYFGSVIAPPMVRFVSFRQTFSNNIKAGFPDFTMYTDTIGPLTARKLIVQVESLWRLDISAECPDLLILDECESIFEQFDSGLLRGNFNECFAKFQYLLRYSKHVIAMDAGLSDRTYRVLMKMRVTDPAQMLYYHDTYQNATGDKYYICGDSARWYASLYTAIELDERIAVPMSSIKEAKALVVNLERKYPQKIVKLYSSETPQSERKEHFGDVNKWWKYEVLIYTPTISAGVSFEEVWFHKVFGYFTDLSCPVETCTQMIGRIRDVSSHEYYIYLAHMGNAQPTTVEAITKSVYDRRAHLATGFDNTGLTVEYGPVGEITIHTGEYFHLWVENMRVKNLSKNVFAQRFIQQVRATGACVEWLSPAIVSDRSGLIDTDLTDYMETLVCEHKVAKKQIVTNICTEISAAVEIGPAEAEEIIERRRARIDITPAQKWSYEKFRLRADYAYEGPIDEKFVMKYHDPSVRRNFKNLTRIESGALSIQAEELSAHRYLMENDQSSDLNRRYVFDQHRYALGMLRLCGWDGLEDRKFIHIRVLAQTLIDQWNIYWANITCACVEFGIHAPSIARASILRGTPDMMVAYMMKTVDKIMNIMYGVRIRADIADPTMWKQMPNTSFTRSRVVSASKHMPMITPPVKTVDLGEG